MRYCVATRIRQFDATSRIRYSHEAGWSSLVARRAHNPKVVSSNLTPATNSIDSQGLVGLHQQAPLLFGKDLGKKSLFPYQSPAIQCQRVDPISPPPLAHLA